MTQAANDGSSEHPAALFIAALFGPTTELPVFFQSLANDARDQDEARYKPQLLTRDIAPIGRFITRHDRARRGLFFCVATVAKDASTRSKETVRETIGLHTDIDFKSVLEDEPTIRTRLDTLHCPATVRVRSGGGLHLYWLFRESVDTQTYREPLEIALKALAEIIAGDPAVCEVSRLMRLPGTHNSKYGDMRQVVCETLDGPRYELDELEEWLSEQQPVLTRKDKIGTGRVDAGSYPSEQTENGGANAVFQMREQTGNDNPFAAFAKQTGEKFGYKPRLDVDAMLAAMTEGNVHDTQIRVAASLIRTGHPPEQVEQILMEATRLSMGDKKWDWRLEQDTYIRKAIDSAVRRFSPRKPVISHETPDDPAPVDENIVNFGEAKAQRKPRQTTKDGDKVDHIDIGTLFLESLKTAGQAVMFTEKGSYCYEDGLWRLLDDRSLKAWLNSHLETCVRLTKAKSNNKLIGEARAWIIRHPELQKKNIQFDAHGCVPTQSGLIDPQSGSIISYRPDHYCTWRVPFAYDPHAACPYWLQMLADVFADRPEAVQREYIALVQEWMGMGLLDARAKALSCILFFQGGTDYGKSELIDVLAGLFGGRRNNTPIDMLDKPHGLMAFVSRSPWVLPEAFDQGKWHFSSVTKALASGEPVQINMKNGGIFDHTFTGPIIWGANSDPQFKEATAAITNRLLIVPCHRKFDPRNPVGAAIAARAAGLDKPSQLVLRDEMLGVLAWAVEGLVRARPRGYFLRPEESLAAAEAVQEGNNIVLRFVKDCVTFDPDSMVSVSDFAAAFASWWAEYKGGERGVPGSESVSKALKSLADPRIALDLRDNSRRYYAGVRLNVEGKRYWNNAVTSDAFVFQSRKASTTESGGDPNRSIPASWSGKAVIEAMLMAHKKSVTGRGDGSVTDLPLPGDSSELSPEPSSELSSTQATDSPEDIPF